jgi:hypothetical protein
MTVSASLRVNGRLARRRDDPGGEEPPAGAGFAAGGFVGRGLIAV